MSPYRLEITKCDAEGQEECDKVCAFIDATEELELVAWFGGVTFPLSPANPTYSNRLIKGSVNDDGIAEEVTAIAKKYSIHLTRRET